MLGRGARCRDRVSTKEAKAVVVATHAAYKEHMYLADYLMKQWLAGEAMNLAEELHVGDALWISLGS